MLAIHYFTLSTLRKSLHCCATNFYYIKVISIIKIKACRLNGFIAIKFCPSAKCSSKKIQPPQPCKPIPCFSGLATPFLPLFLPMPLVFTIHDKVTVQSIVGSQICFSGPFNSLAVTQQWLFFFSCKRRTFLGRLQTRIIAKTSFSGCVSLQQTLQHLHAGGKICSKQQKCASVYQTHSVAPE